MQIRVSLQCPVVLAAVRQRPQDFTRRCPLTVARVVLIIVRGHKLSLQNALNKVFSTLVQVFKVPSSGAFCHARRKLKPEVFTHLNRLVTNFFYAEADEARRWRGHRMLSVEATFLNLPDTAASRAAYSLQTNQHEGAQYVQAQCGLLYDVLNDLGLALTLGQRQGETSVLLTVLSRNTRSRQPCASGSSASF